MQVWGKSLGGGPGVVKCQTPLTAQKLKFFLYIYFLLLLLWQYKRLDAQSKKTKASVKKKRLKMIWLKCHEQQQKNNKTNKKKTFLTSFITKINNNVNKLKTIVHIAVR